MIVLLSTSDTDLLSARASGAAYRLANPARLEVEDLRSLLEGATAVVVRILGGRQAWADGLDAVAASGVPTIVLGGEVSPGRRAHAAVHRARRRGCRGARLPGPRRPGQPAPAGPVPVRRDRPHRRGLRAPQTNPHLGNSGTARKTRANKNRHLVLPRPPPGGQHRLRPRPRRCHRERRRPGAAGVLLLAAHRGARADRRTEKSRRDRGHRAGRRAGWCPPRPAPEGPTRTGTSARWPAWTSRSCRACA